MSRLGIQKRTWPQRRPDTRNVAGGDSFTLTDPVVRLLHTVGFPGFNEPTEYYRIPDTKDPRVARAFTSSFDTLTGSAKVIVETALAVANGDNPRDLLAIAHWLRKEGHCRQTPLVLLACAAASKSCQRFVRGYAPQIIRRADEIVGAYAAYRYLFGKPIPSCLLKGIRDAFLNFDEYQLIKYNQSGKNPNLKDVLLQMPDRKPGKPVSRGMAEFLMNGSLVDKNGVDYSESAPLTAAYLRFLKAANNSSWNKEMEKLAEDAKATWEVVISQFGGSKETWSSVFPRMGYMAVLRNIRNMVLAGVDSRLIAERIADRKAVLRSKQFPFRFLAASNEIVRAGFSVKDRKIILDAISIALEHSVENVGTIPGDTVVLVDVSGSMSSAVSGRSKMSCKDVATCLAAIFAKACENAYVYAFGARQLLLDVRSTDSVSTIIEKIQKAQGYCGHATYAYKPFYDAIEKGLKADRIVLLSDMQCYTDGTYFYRPYERQAADNRTVATGLHDYRRRLNHDTWLHSVNLRSLDGTAQVSSDEKNVNLVSGFSDKILSLFLEAEGHVGTPTLDYIRDNF